MTPEEKSAIARDRVTVGLLNLLCDVNNGQCNQEEVFNRFEGIAKVAVPLIGEGVIRVPSSWQWKGTKPCQTTTPTKTTKPKKPAAETVKKSSPRKSKATSN